MQVAGVDKSLSEDIFCGYSLHRELKRIKAKMSKKSSGGTDLSAGDLEGNAFCKVPRNKGPGRVRDVKVGTCIFFACNGGKAKPIDYLHITLNKVALGYCIVLGITLY